MSADVSRHAIVQAYRDLYRAGLRAVQYAPSSRYVVRDRLRRAFRESPIDDFEPQRIANTIKFFNNAAKDRGMEHRLVKSLCNIWYWEQKHWAARSRTWSLKQAPKMNRPQLKWEAQAYDNFYWTLKMLNESMGLCIR